MKNLTDTSAFTSPVTCPEDGVDLVEGSTVESPFQALANRTKYLYDTLAGVVARIVSDEWTYPTPKTRTVRIHGGAFAQQYSGTDGAGYPDESSFIFDQIGPGGDGGRVIVDLGAYLQTGHEITQLNFRVKPGAARVGNARMGVMLLSYTGDGTSNNHGGAVYDDGTTAAQTVSKTGLSVTVDRSTTRYLAWVIGGETANVNNDTLYYVEVVYSDPGPRNF